MSSAMSKLPKSTAMSLEVSSLDIFSSLHSVVRSELVSSWVLVVPLRMLVLSRSYSDTRSQGVLCSP